MIFNGKKLCFLIEKEYTHKKWRLLFVVLNQSSLGLGFNCVTSLLSKLRTWINYKRDIFK